MPFRIIYLGGLAGAGRLEESARKSAAVFNQIHPYYMYLTNVAVLPGTKLYGQMMRGEFTEATEKERLQEIRTLLAEMRNPIVVDTESAASSIYLKVKLPEERPRCCVSWTRSLPIFPRNRKSFCTRAAPACFLCSVREERGKDRGSSAE